MRFARHAHILLHILPRVPHQHHQRTRACFVSFGCGSAETSCGKLAAFVARCALGYLSQSSADTHAHPCLSYNADRGLGLFRGSAPQTPDIVSSEPWIVAHKAQSLQLDSQSCRIPQATHSDDPSRVASSSDVKSRRSIEN